MTGPHDSRSADALADQCVDPQALVGQYVRRRDDRGPQRFTPWAQIAMAVPSVSGLCCLVCFIDGEVDVWRIDDAAAHYEFRFAQKGN
jgi:hypothetical protein